MKIILLAILLLLQQCHSQDIKLANGKKNNYKQFTAQDWQEKLTPEQYEVLRLKGTELPHSGAYVQHFEKGSYACAACGNVLFKSTAKFYSSCGWPSFDQAIEGSVTYTKDTSYGMERIEVCCKNCGGHLGHVFDDGPAETTGKRYCTNSISIQFNPEK